MRDRNRPVYPWIIHQLYSEAEGIFVSSLAVRRSRSLPYSEGEVGQGTGDRSNRSAGSHCFGRGRLGRLLDAVRSAAARIGGVHLVWELQRDFSPEDGGIGVRIGDGPAEVSKRVINAEDPLKVLVEGFGQRMKEKGVGGARPLRRRRINASENEGEGVGGARPLRRRRINAHSAYNIKTT
ncbi:hypothetical protein AXF42_Ash009085 [Apostasia shenzhenica]|uniref:Uncharacterized protein n=1 Tax=Apostasia shenzhenica TaxID=1088818 RepID=A0A2I0ADG5_9ASPA|nr:hypothetical protein AXF42_Ash009085 [Apostasia shenzhenica]